MKRGRLKLTRDDAVMAHLRASSRQPLVWMVTTVRIAAAFYLFVDPLWGFILALTLDTLDGTVLKHLAGMGRTTYHVWDKLVDWIIYLVMLIVGISYGVFVPLALLLLYRSVGMIVFFQTRNPVWFLLFPSFFEVGFIFWVIGQSTGFASHFSPVQNWQVLILLFILKEIQEMILHFIWRTKLFGNSPLLRWVDKKES